MKSSIIIVLALCVFSAIASNSRPHTSFTYKKKTVINRASPPTGAPSRIKPPLLLHVNTRLITLITTHIIIVSDEVLYPVN